MTNPIPMEAAIAAIAITAIIVAGVVAFFMVGHRKAATPPSPKAREVKKPPRLFVLTNTDGQICHLEERPVITGDLEEARYLQARLMEHETMTVITVYTPDHII